MTKTRKELSRRARRENPPRLRVEIPSLTMLLHQPIATLRTFNHDARMEISKRLKQLSKGLASALAIIALASCAPAEDEIPTGATILDASEIPNILAQCSRLVPESGEGSWTPTAKDIRNLEIMLPSALRKAQPKQDWNGFPQQWRRQFVGITRNKQHYLYGNYMVHGNHTPEEISQNFQTKAIGACDGGPSYFGAEYHIETGKITHLDFNGPY